MTHNRTLIWQEIKRKKSYSMLVEEDELCSKLEAVHSDRERTGQAKWEFKRIDLNVMTHAQSMACHTHSSSKTENQRFSNCNA